MTQTIRQQIVERIAQQDNQNPQPLFITISDSAELDDALKSNNVSEGCFVIKLEKVAKTASEYYQLVTESYQIVTLCRNLTDPNGQAVAELAEQMQQTVFNALSGFCPRDEDGDKTEPMQFINGGLIDLTNGFHIWQDVYALTYTQAIYQQED